MNSIWYMIKYKVKCYPRYYKDGTIGESESVSFFVLNNAKTTKPIQLKF